MASPTFVVITIVPSTPLSPADFVLALAGLQVSVYEISYSAPNGTTPAGTPNIIGTASLYNLSSPPPVPLNVIVVPDATAAVATVVIDVSKFEPSSSPPYAEYLTSDLRLSVTRNGQTITDTELDYNVPWVTPTAVHPKNSAWYAGLGPVARYLEIPPADPANAPSVSLPTNGTPPNFANLKAAITTVLQADPGGTVTDATIAKLTLAQCTHIAYELTFNRNTSPLPAPGAASGGKSLKDMFTLGSGSNPDPNSTNREQFEGALTAFYSNGGAQANALAGYIYGVATSIANAATAAATTTATFNFPILPGATNAGSTVTDADVTVTDTAPLGFSVPADYFYALTAQLPTNLDAPARYQYATTLSVDVVAANLEAAIQANVVAPGLALSTEQAAWQLSALGPVSPAAPVFSFTANASVQYASSVKSLFQKWLQIPLPSNNPPTPDADMATFWNTTVPANTAYMQGQLALALVAMAQQGNLSTFLNALSAGAATLGITVGSVKDLDPAAYGLSATPISTIQWLAFFQANPNAMPTFATVGTGSGAPSTILQEQVTAFVLRLTQFFGAPSPATPGGPTLASDLLPTLPTPSGIEPFAPFASQMGFASYGGSATLDPTAAAAAAAVVLPADPAAQAWLVEAASALNALVWVTTFAPLSGAPNLQFTVVESLYARGFTSVAQIAAIPQNLFVDALIGSPAYTYALAIQARALTVAAPVTPPTAPQPPFGPINAGGKLVNCIAPPWLSPLGPVAYLRDLWLLSEAATCKEPALSTSPTLGDAVATRRGPVGTTLLATKANLETPLPRIDLVNECLESVVGGAAVATIYQTTTTGDDAERKLAAIPEWSSPTVPGSTASPAYAKLATDFSSPSLPYAQALDVSRSILGALGTSRFKLLTTFRKNVTSFVLDPVNPPAGFRAWQHRYPLPDDLALELLGISAEEYATLFGAPITAATLPSFYGFPLPAPSGWETTACVLGHFLARLGLTYAEFVELAGAGFIAIALSPANGQGAAAPPPCPPCCLDDFVVVFPTLPVDQALTEVAIFIRLWRKLQLVPEARYSFATLADIAGAFGLFVGSANPPVVSADFVRQLAAFQLLRDEFHLPLQNPASPSAAGATGTARTPVLGLFTSSPPDPWAVSCLLDGIARHARRHHRCEPRTSHFVKLLATNLSELAPLVGFEPATAPWSSFPARVLRFAEALSKLYASKFSVGELLFLLDTDGALDRDDPFPLPTAEESEEFPLDLPDDSEFSLSRLRARLLATELRPGEAERWTWSAIADSLREEFGFSAPTGGTDPILALGSHFFPELLGAAGTTVTPANRQYRTPLAGSPAAMWNAPTDGPFRYDSGTSELWTEIPLSDEAVLEKLSHIRTLTGPETTAVQSLYFAPRATLAPFGFLFRSAAEAEHGLIAEPNEAARWAYFQRSFALARTRAEIIAEHLAAHVAKLREHDAVDGPLAWKILKHLSADENGPITGNGGAWENDTPPATEWQKPTGGSFAALLGLLGTGLLTSLWAGTSFAGTPLWQEAGMPTFEPGRAEDRWNAPLPTVLPALSTTLPPSAMGKASIRNGIAVAPSDGRPFGGVAEHALTWTGVFLVDEAGPHRFFAETRPEGHAWRVTLTRGQKSWLVLAHAWPGADAAEFDSSSIPLKRGAYDLTIELVRSTPNFDRLEGPHPFQTGFHIHVESPATRGEKKPLPLFQLFVKEKTPPRPRDGNAVPLLTPSATVQSARYVSSLRDMRRTYQRAVKAMLFAYRFGLHARPSENLGHSELGYLLANGGAFAGMSFTGATPTWTEHTAWLDFDLLPVGDPYEPTTTDIRATPTVARQQALFDVWERMFDYARLRREAHAASRESVWHLFDEASENPADASQIVRYLGITPGAWPFTGTFADGTAAGYLVAPSDLVNEIWATRVWFAHEWVRALFEKNPVVPSTLPNPALWAATAPVTSGGNANLLAFFQTIALGPERRYEDLVRLDDALRERARRALLASLVGPSKTYKAPRDVSAQFLLDVEAGLGEQATRIDDAVSAVQAFVERARLGLESWTPSDAFLALWDGRYATFHTWRECKRREIYRENWIEWDELAEARRTEAFRFLEEELAQATLTTAVPGGMTYWSNAALPPKHPGLKLLQASEPATVDLIPSQPEALDLRGVPDASGHRAWLASVASMATQPEPPRQREPDAKATTPNAAATLVPSTQPLAWWFEAAVRLGVKFLRVPAAAVPPASNTFAPHHHDRHACCKDCGRRHEAVIDEYYFWLVEGRYLSTFDPTAIQDSIQNWDDDPPIANAGLAALLAWPARKNVYLFWARRHDGVLLDPRRSSEAFPLSAQPGAAAPALALEGRTADSLLFGVSPADPTLPNPLTGFRYDLALDRAVVVPSVLPLNPPTPIVAGLSAYPYFAYFLPGVPLAPLSTFSESVAVASALRTHCQFDAALRWYKLTLDPFAVNLAWCPSDAAPNQPPPPSAPPPQTSPTIDAANPSAAAPNELRLNPSISACCSSGAVSPATARNRAIVLDFLETLLEWGDSTMRKNTPEAFERARILFEAAERILGKHPLTVLTEAPPTVSPVNPPTVVNLPAVGAPLNPRLLALYDRLDDRLGLIHRNESARRLPNGKLGRSMRYWEEPGISKRAWRPERSCCAQAGEPMDRCGCDDCCGASPYRFAALIPKASEFAAEVRAFVAEYLAAREKGDAEAYLSLRTVHEHQLLDRAIGIREDAWRAADWDVQGLEQRKLELQNELQYYTQLIAAGLIGGEVTYENDMNGAIGALTAAVASLTTATIVGVIPDVFVGMEDFTWLPVGTKLAAVFQGIAAVSSTTSQILSTTANLNLTEAGWDRRLAEWRHRVDVLNIQIQEVIRQILAAQRRRDGALRELNNAVLQREQSREVLTFLRDKFTGAPLQLFLAKSKMGHLRELYDLATRVAKQAERAFNFERGDTSRRFVSTEAWDDLKGALVAADRLLVALARMDQCYRDENVREYELTKHISLRQLFPREFLELKLRGRTELTLPEWLFDLDYPGQYMRRIKNVSLTIPCVAGPYTGVHCRLTLLASETRIAPWLMGPLERCCAHKPLALPPLTRPHCGCHPLPPQVNPHDPRCGADHRGYESRPEDPRFVRRHLSREAIATSDGQRDTGLFELNFRDERYLPFEFEGAISRWRIELPQENNFFDMETLTDVVLHLNYTAREGGEELRRAANASADHRLPDDGERYVDVRQTMPVEWRRFEALDPAAHERRLPLRIDRDLFPFVPGRRDYWVTRIEVAFEAHEGDRHDHHELAFALRHRPGCKAPPHRLLCVAEQHMPGIFRGRLDFPIGPLGREEALGELVFGPHVGPVRNVFLNVSYVAVRRGERAR